MAAAEASALVEVVVEGAVVEALGNQVLKVGLRVSKTAASGLARKTRQE